MWLNIIISLMVTPILATHISCSSDEAAQHSSDKSSATPSKKNQKVAADAKTDYTYYRDVKPIIDKYCVACHGPNPIDGAGKYYRLNQYETTGFLQGVFSMRALIKARMKDGSMPPDGNPAPSQKEIDMVAAWVDGGAPEGDPADTPDTSSGQGDNSRGQVIFTAPTGTSEAPASNNIYQVKINFSGYYNNFTWDVAYFPEGHPDLARTVATDIPNTQTTYNFDLSILPSGKYGIAIKVEDKTYLSPGLVEFNNPGKNNNNPDVKLLGAWLVGGGQVISSANRIEYSASDINGDALSVKIELSSNGGKSYDTLIVNNTPNANGFTWNASSANIPEGVQYRVRLTVTDGVGGRTVVASKQNVGLGNKLYTWKNDAFPRVLDPLCSSCHRNRPYDSDLYAGQNGAFQYRNAVVEFTVKDVMPTTNNKASARQKEILQLWLMQGAAEE